MVSLGRLQSSGWWSEEMVDKLESIKESVKGEEMKKGNEYRNF